MAAVEKELVTLADRLHGFAYILDLPDAKDWDESKVDPLQKANTPLLHRALPPRAAILSQTVESPPSTMPKSNLMLMTDYERYSLHEACQEQTMAEEGYSVQLWQYVETFVYFVHRRIAIPPPAWVNAGHRNGAMVLGTFICEGDLDPQSEVILEMSNGRYWLADRLARIAACYGFDGWLFNMESPIKDPNNAWNGGKPMKDFITQLRDDLSRLVPSGGKVVWYDSLTEQNQIGYQNTLNSTTLPFTQLAGSIATNYWWTGNEQMVKDAGNFAVKSKLNRDDVYFGKISYRDMATGLGIKLPAMYGLGAFLFATGWCYQDFGDPNTAKDLGLYRSDADRYMWEGWPDLTDIQKANVTCKVADGNNFKYVGIDQTGYISHDQASKCITNFAKKYPAGSEGFFHTDYGKAVAYLGPQTYKSHLSEQSVYPDNWFGQLNIPNATKSAIRARLNDTRATCSIGISVVPGAALSDNLQFDGRIVLHELNARGDANLNLTVSYQRLAELPGVKISVFAVMGSQTPEIVLDGATGSIHTSPPLALNSSHDRITAVGIRLQGPAKLFSANTTDVLDIHEMTLKPANDNYPACKIQNVVIKQDGTGADLHHRLDWSLSPSPEKGDPAFKSKYLPYSKVTGPFSHFIVSINGSELGRAYTPAYVLDPKIASGVKIGGDAKVDVKIQGVAFDGSILDTFSDHTAWH